VVIELCRVRCPECGIKAEKVALLPSKAPFSECFEEAVGQACESAALRRVARQFGIAASTVRAIDLRYLRRPPQHSFDPGEETEVSGRLRRQQQLHFLAETGISICWRMVLRVHFSPVMGSPAVSCSKRISMASIISGVFFHVLAASSGSGRAVHFHVLGQ